METHDIKRVFILVILTAAFLIVFSQCGCSSCKCKCRKKNRIIPPPLPIQVPSLESEVVVIVAEPINIDTYDTYDTYDTIVEAIAINTPMNLR